MRLIAHGLVNPPSEPLPLSSSDPAAPATTPTPAAPPVEPAVLTAAQVNGLKAQVSSMLKSNDPDALLAAARKALADQTGVNSPLATKFEALIESFLQETSDVAPPAPTDTSQSTEAQPALKSVESAIQPPKRPPPPLAQRLALFRETCFTNHRGYWSYEVCVGRYVRQYHQDKGKVEAQNWLGRRIVANAIRDAADLKAVQATMHGFDRDALLQSSPRGVTQEFKHGSPCGSVAVARSSKVTFHCLAGEDIKTSQMSVEEDEACHYTITVNTPLIC
eukprot:m.193511 g.193511  ORF g.193511 m.193511 type:complete len:277 (+) comp16980_c0_seq26:142-972(+)